MRYAQTGITGYIPPGGVCPGHRYEDRPDQADPHMSVDCRVCDPYLAADPLWAGTPSQVPLTAREQAELDEQKAKAEAVTARMMAQMADRAMAVVAAEAARAEAAAAPPAPKRPRARKPAARTTA